MTLAIQKYSHRAMAMASPAAEVTYVSVLLWTAGASILANIVGRVLVETASPSDSRQGDVRDKEIYRFGEYASRWFLVAGAAAATMHQRLAYSPNR